MSAHAPILLTGFDAFEGSAINPSWEVAHALHGHQCEGADIVAVQLPTVFGRSLQLLDDSIEQLQPQMVICLGLAGGRPMVSLERIGINVMDARIPDNAGQQPIDEPIVADGPAAYFSTLPIKAMREAMQAVGCPAEISQTAGTYVCNQTLYGVLHLTQGHERAARRRMRAGFVHVPWLPGLGAPALPLEVMVSGLMQAVVEAMRRTEDARMVGGATH